MTTSLTYDLHCHTTCSDGSLSPLELVHRAAENGVGTLSITDHDTALAYSKLGDAEQLPLQIIPGIEFSTEWRKVNIHIVGLNINPDSDALKAGVTYQQQARKERAERIAEKLTNYGFENVLDRTAKIAGNNNIGRPHFAQYLVEIGAANNIKQAFKKFLGSGKPCDIKQLWADLPQIVEWIQEAGGTPVLAHPAKYKLTRTKLLAFLDDFIAAGGQGMEVVSGKQIPSTTRDLANICRLKKLYASCGSDFHQPGQDWAELGKYSTFPADCEPVWERW